MVFVAFANFLCQHESMTKQERLNDLSKRMRDVETPLKYNAKNFVFSDGNIDARLMLVGEAPGEQEDIMGLPFVGPAGQLLNKMLVAINMDRKSDCYIANILPWRPENNRTPTRDEMNLFLPYVMEHIKIIKPDVLVLLGGTSAKAILQTNTGIMRLRGHWVDVNGIPTMPTFHPSFLLRDVSMKRYAWQDLKQIRDKLAEVQK